MKKTGFQHKVAIITGSSRGIGKATAIELAKLGAKVVINGRDPERLKSVAQEIKKYNENVMYVCADISDPGEARGIVDRTIESFGQLDILVNNAAVSMRGYISDLDPAVFKSVFDTNVQGVVNMTIPAIPHLRNTRGSVVFISSLAGIRGLPIQSAYSASKMALRSIAESIRIEERKSGIHVGLIHVGITEFEPGKQILSADGSMMPLKEKSILKIHSPQSVAKAILKNISRRRFRTTLTGIGKILSMFQLLLPALVERVLVYTLEKENIRWTEDDS